MFLKSLDREARVPVLSWIRHWFGPPSYLRRINKNTFWRWTYFPNTYLNLVFEYLYKLKERMSSTVYEMIFAGMKIPVSSLKPLKRLCRSTYLYTYNVILYAAQIKFCNKI